MDDNVKTYQVGNLLVKINRSKCLSCAACTAIAPKTFELDGELMSTVKPAGPYDDEKTIIEAAAGCPNEAIVVGPAGKIV